MSLQAALEHEMSSPFPGGAPDQFVTKALPATRASADYQNATIMGWRRENGRVGVRNHVVLLPLDDLSNAACEAVANNVKGTLAAASRVWTPSVRRRSRGPFPHPHRYRI